MHTLASRIPPARYFPFASGQYTTAPSLHKLTTDFGNGKADQRIFQIDAQWPLYFQNKVQCREESIEKYFKTHQLREKAAQQLTQFIIQQLLGEYPSIFSLEEQQEDFLFTNHLNQEVIRFDQNYTLIEPGKYVSALDALACQVQEDMAVWQREGDADRMTMIHLCAPNHWSPAEKIGKPFSWVHQPVAGMEKMRQRYQPMMKTLIRGGHFVRFAWGLSTDNRLNHHPELAPGWETEAWQGRHFDPDNPSLYVRVERQTLSGFPEADAVLFTIRTYFEEVRKMEPVHRKALLKALTSMSAEALEYKGLKKNLDNIGTYLRTI